VFMCSDSDGKKFRDVRWMFVDGRVKPLFDLIVRIVISDVIFDTSILIQSIRLLFLKMLYVL